MYIRVNSVSLTALIGALGLVFVTFSQADSQSLPALIGVVGTDATVGSVDSATTKVPTTERSAAAPSDSNIAPRDNASILASPKKAESVKKVRSHNELNMSMVQRIRLMTLDYAALNQEYSIDDDRTLSISAIGRVNVDGMTPVELEQVLSTRISRYARKDVKVSIEILKYRSYFITGMISLSGENEWKPRLNIVKAIALAGGTRRQASVGDSPVASLSIEQSRTRLHFSLALLARLKAERDGLEKVDRDINIDSVLYKTPARVRPRLRQFMARQDAALQEQRDLLKWQVAGLEKDRATAKKELDAAVRQEATVRSQLDISKSVMKDLDRLKKKGYVSNSRVLEQRSTIMSGELRVSEAQTATERARSRHEGLARQIDLLPRQRKIELNQRIETLEREIAQLEIQLLPTPGGGIADSGDSPLRLSYSIARETPTGIVHLEANVFTPVLPGDVIIVAPGQPKEQVVGLNASPASYMATSSIESVPSETIYQVQRDIESSSTSRALGFGGAGSRQ